MRGVRRILLAIGCLTVARQLPAADTNAVAQLSRVIETAGRVEFQTGPQANWLAATNGLALRPGERLRTHAQSRAAVQFSDRSVLRLNENTTLEIQAPRRAEKRRFRLWEGLLFFFNRERPADVEFETPVVSGAIRGTEFILEASAGNGATRLALLDGAVELAAAGATVSLQSGEQARVEPGQAPVKSPLLEVVSLVQWALYYPAVVHPGDVPFAPEDRDALAKTLDLYRAGDLLVAHAAMTEVPAGGEARELFRAALDLAVGRVDSCESWLASLPADAPVARALRELIALVRNPPSQETASMSPLPTDVPATASEWLARSYSLQGRFQLRESRAAAQRAAEMAPEFAFAHVRFAELEMAFEHRRPAREALHRALTLAPRLAQGHALRGFLSLDEHHPRAALDAFDQAIAIDAAHGNAWLGRGLAQLRLHQRDEALRSFQTAAALEPRRALVRSYLGKAFSVTAEPKLAEKDFRLAKELDPGDPTAWLYSALHQWQENRPNVAVRELERSVELNDNQGVFRSRLLLDRDRAVRSANLAAVYRDAGLSEVGLRSAARAVNEDYANFSGHLFLANSYQSLETANRFDLRFETARLSELLVANLLAPVGAGNLSQLLSQHEHLRFFDPQSVGVSIAGEYRSTGDWLATATAFGTLGELSYALDAAGEWRHGEEPNAKSRRRHLGLQLKQRLGPQDELYLQASVNDFDAGDVARHFSPSDARRNLRVSEDQVPNIYLGWHRAWTPASHTLLMVSRLSDSFALRDQGVNALLLRPNAQNPTSVSTVPNLDVRFGSDFTLYSAELQQLWQTERHAIVAGGRFQAGDVESDATLARRLPVPAGLSNDHIDESLQRANGYLYWHWHMVEPLRLIAGVSYDHLKYPRNTDLPPLTAGEKSRDRLAPKAGFLLTPWRDGLVRGAYTRSLGGLFFDNSVRLEPAHLAGFNQAFRSLLPESRAGLVPGTAFETASVGFDQSLRGGLYFGVETEWLRSDGERTVGVFPSSVPTPIPGITASTRQTLDYRERNVSAYAVQLLGDGLSAGARYRLSEAKFDGRFPSIPSTASGLNSLDQHERSLLHQVELSINYQHPCGAFGQWESSWFHQHNTGYASTRATEDFWQHNLWAGYRFPRRHAEVRVGLLNLFDQDYRLSPLNFYAPLPRGRTAVVSVRFNF